jgi:hypothetical protein
VLVEDQCCRTVIPTFRYADSISPISQSSFDAQFACVAAFVESPVVCYQTGYSDCIREAMNYINQSQEISHDAKHCLLTTLRCRFLGCSLHGIADAAPASQIGLPPRTPSGGDFLNCRPPAPYRLSTTAMFDGSAASVVQCGNVGVFDISGNQSLNDAASCATPTSPTDNCGGDA